MKKTLIVASIAGVCALAFSASAYADTPPRYHDWFEAVKQSGEDAESGVLPGDLDPTSGSWSFGTGVFSWDSTDGFGYELTDGSVVYTADQAAAPDTNTVTEVSLISYFSPVLCCDDASPYSELPAPDSGSQVGFVAVALTNASGAATFSYRAWTGDGWFGLEGATPDDEEDIPTTLVASFDYRDATPTVQFTIITNGVETLLTTGTVSKFEIVGAAATAVAAAGQKILGLKCYGSGNVKSLTAQIAEAIAEINGKKYISLVEANAAANEGDTIDVLAETDESITLADGVEISNAVGRVTGTISAGADSTVTVDLSETDVGYGANGTYTVNVKTGGSGTIEVKQPLANKEIADGTTSIVAGESITVTIHTKTTLLQAMRPDEDNKDKVFTVDNTTNSPLRVFLEKNSPAYRASDASTESIQSELRGVPAGSNGLKLWQDYVLTIEPETVVKPVSPAAGDTSTTDIKLEIPTLSGVSPRDGYTVTYKVYKEGVAEAVATAASADAIQIPVSSGSGKYTVKAVLTPAE